MVSSLKVWPYILLGSRLCPKSELVRRLAQDSGFEFLRAQLHYGTRLGAFSLTSRSACALHRAAIKFFSAAVTVVYFSLSGGSVSSNSSGVICSPTASPLLFSVVFLVGCSLVNVLARRLGDLCVEYRNVN